MKIFDKKTILIVTASMLLCFSSVAQIKYGIKAGVNASSITNTSNASYRLGSLIGGFAEFGDNPIAARVEALLSSEGASFAGGLGEFKLSYLNFPLLIKYKIDGKASVYAGPQFGTLLKATDQDGVDISEQFEDAVIDLSLGMDCEIIDHIQVSLRYNMGLLRTPRSVDDAKNSVWQFAVEYAF